MSTVGNQVADKLLTTGDLDPSFVLPSANLASTLTGKTITDSSNTVYASAGPSGSPFSFRNKIINGNFDVWQRGTASINLTTSAVYFADRWSVKQQTSAAGTASRQTTSTGNYSIRLGRNSGSTLLTNISLAYISEAIDAIKLRGKTVTMSFVAKCGADFSAAALGAQIRSQTGAEQTAEQAHSGFAGGTYPLATNQAITTSEVKYSFSATIPSDCTQFAICLFYVPTGTAGANDWFEISQVQLEAGSVATPFETRPYGVELALCQRYYQVHGGGTAGTSLYFSASASSGQYIGASWLFPVTMRTVPSPVARNGTWAITNLAGQPILQADVMGFSLVQQSSGTGPVSFYPNSTDDTCTFSAEF